MFWQREDVANMCLWDDPVAILGSSFWTKRGNSGRDQGKPRMHMFIFGKRALHMRAFCPWRFMKYIQPPPFSCKETTLNKPGLIVCQCSLPLFRLLIITAAFVVENCEK